MHTATQTGFHLRSGVGRGHDRAFFVVLVVASLLATSIMALIAGYLLRESAPLLREVGVLRLVLDGEWAPRNGQFDLRPMMAASLIITAGALLVTTPVSIGFAVYCAFYASRRQAAALMRLVDISAGLPTVIYGFWGLTVVVPWINEIAPPGTSVLAGVLVLSLMVFPTITVMAHAAVAAVPRKYIYASTALGVRMSSTIFYIILRRARPGILAAMTLGAARAIGETVVVLMVCGNVVQMPGSIFDPVRTLTANIALEMQYARGLHQSALYATGLAVLLVVSLLALLSEMSARRIEREDR